MIKVLSLAALSLAGAAAFAAVVPPPDGGRDLTKIPADPAVREKELSAAPITLAKAMEIVVKDGGALSSAAFSNSGHIELTLYQGGAEHTVVVDGKSGAIVSKTARQRFPGDAVTGEGTTLASGLMYYDIKVGDGAEVIAKTGNATVHCTGWLVNGNKFWSSYDGGQPLSFSLQGGVIQGWLDGIPGMKVGGKRKLVIPGQLAYGASGRPPAIPPNAVLVFDIELLSVP